VEQKRKKKSKGLFRSFIIKIVLGIFFVYVAVSFIQLRVQISELKDRYEVLQQEIAEKEVRVEELKEVNKLLDEGKDKDYIAKIAREYGFANKDEKVYKNGKNG